MAKKNPCKVISISRAAATKFIEDMRQTLASAHQMESSEGVCDAIESSLREMVTGHEMSYPLKGGEEILLVACEGEAHDEPNIDNCSQCAPRWGYIGLDVKVK